MNTKYKISLLLALTAMVGNNVNAVSPVTIDYAPLSEVGSRVTQSRAEFGKLEKVFKSGAASRISQLMAEAVANAPYKNGKDTSAAINAVYGADAEVTKIIDSNKAAATAKRDMSDLFKKLNEDIDNLKAGSYKTTVLGGSAANGSAATKSVVDNFVSATKSGAKIDSVVKGFDAILSDAVNGITCQTTEVEAFVGLLVKHYAEITQKIESAASSSVTFGNETVPLGDALKVVQNGIFQAIGEFSSKYADLSAASSAVETAVADLVQKKDAVGRFVATMNLDSSDSSSAKTTAQTAFLKKIIAADFKAAEGKAWDTLETALIKNNGSTNAEHGAAWLTYLTATYGAGAPNNTDGQRLFDYKVSGAGVATAADKLTTTEFLYALGLDGESKLTDALSAAHAQTEIDSLRNLMLKNLNLFNNNYAAASGYKGSQTLQMLKDLKNESPTKLKRVNWNLAGNTKFQDVKEYFAYALKQAKALAASGAANLATVAPAWKTDLTDKLNFVVTYFNGKMGSLMGPNAVCEDTVGIAAKMTRSRIEDSIKEIQTSYDAIISALGSPSAAKDAVDPNTAAKDAVDSKPAAQGAESKSEDDVKVGDLIQKSGKPVAAKNAKAKAAIAALIAEFKELFADEDEKPDAAAIKETTAEKIEALVEEFATEHPDASDAQKKIAQQSITKIVKQAMASAAGKKAAVRSRFISNKKPNEMKRAKGIGRGTKKLPKKAKKGKGKGKEQVKAKLKGQRSGAAPAA